MRSCISELLVPSIYDELLCSESVKEYEDIRLMSKNLYFVQHNQPEHCMSDMSIGNLYEAGVLAKLTEFLIQKAQYKHSDIVILSPYNGQIECIKNAVCKQYPIVYYLIFLILSPAAASPKLSLDCASGQCG